jgi:hypothetical protein
MSERPEAASSFTRILVEVMRRKPTRVPPKGEVMALLDHPISADLAAYLHAWAHHSAGFVSVGDWDHDRGPFLTDDPRLAGGAELAIHIGMTGGGDEFVVRIDEEGETVAWVYHDTDEETLFDDFEEFVCDRVYAAHDRERATDLDPLLAEAGLLD